METLLLDILTELREGEGDRLDDRRLARIIHRHSRGLGGNGRRFSKKRLLPYYLKVKESDPERWAGWNVDDATEGRLFQVLRMKPRRTASGVATITVITKPWSCSSNCLYCPSDVRMPKSYLSDEPACQRAERNCFDPYLQVVSRLRALTHMGHATDKVELIVLGGTWSDYPEGYQLWFVTELLRALNDGEDAEQGARTRRGLYRDKGCESRAEERAERVSETQQKVDDGALTYNQAIGRLYGESDVWQDIARGQVATFDELACQHRVNRTARHRVVGLVVETRPDTVTAGSLMLLRQLGCTKVQIGIQSLDPAVLRLNDRVIDLGRVREAFELLRVFGFKTHVHFMANLYGSTPEKDIRDYRRLVTDGAYLPDEVKLYPCSLVAGTGLVGRYRAGDWRPYSEGELLDILTADTLATPGFMRISRMVRDISAQDILAGNRKANLRQLVERRIEEAGERIAEMRYREIGTDETDLGHLALEVVAYETTVSSERFLQWVTPENRLVGFLRLSLPSVEYVRRHQAVLPVGPYEAMIREVHVYGTVVPLHRAGEDGQACAEGEGARPEGSQPHGPGEGAQHLGLGRRLVEAACDIARTQGYQRINVISAVGTREYYQSLGFEDGELYQHRLLV
ncbi:MAG: tRNA uridine(34) 5-carboxymethylaminomethyl modification radical SAM/GNAT enzyme Elp3 [Coriobacteriales bacterium]|nr:tRNA uridine(34) 5-carboxymethylaminomethyl modification radical SAM/GNAT enzyme Elp3 [Coriobacteriales bacterium]